MEYLRVGNRYSYTQITLNSIFVVVVVIEMQMHAADLAQIGHRYDKCKTPDNMKI
jgi:hypothetical protein